MARSDSSGSFRPDIEGLRGVAVFLVVAFHCRLAGFSSGFIGVDVFFVLSGYLITGLLVAEIRRSQRLKLIDFYARRARRLLPAAALTLAVTLAAGTLILAPHELTFLGQAGRATALYVSNIYFSVSASDYFSPAVETNALLHTWSLAVEEQFYLIWPLLIMLGLQVFRSQRALVAVLASLTVASLAVCVWSTPRAATFAFYGLPARAWEFGIGGLAALLPRQATGLPAWGWRGIGWIGLLTVVAAGAFIPGQVGFPGKVALVPVLGTVAALIAGAQAPTGGAHRILNTAPLQFLGTLSYSWYLWHWPFLVLAAALLPGLGTAGRIVVAGVSLFAAAVTHRYVENPIRFHKALIKRPKQSLVLAASLTAFSSGVALSPGYVARYLERSPEVKAIAAASDDVSSLPREQCVSLGVATAVTKCTYGAASSTTHLALFGDSHAIQWFDPIKDIVESRGWRLTTFVKSSCPAVDIAPPGMPDMFVESCRKWRHDTIEEIAAASPSVVILGSSVAYIRRADAPRGAEGVSLDEWREGTARTVDALARAGLRVAVMRDVPRPPFDVPTCLARASRNSWYPGGACEIDRAKALRPEIFEAEQAAIEGLSTVRLVDLTDKLCDATTCWAMKDGLVVYRDDNHLTGAFAASLGGALEEHLSSILAAGPAVDVEARTARGAGPR